MNRNPDLATVFGAHWCPDCRRVKGFLSAHHIDFNWVDLEEHEGATAEIESIIGGKRRIPTILFPDGTHLISPPNDELADRFGITREAARETYDLVIVGGGPTALTTSIYAAREGISTLIVEKSAIGGQAGVTERYDNYPGFPDGIGGLDLADRFKRQAERYGVELLESVAVDRISPVGDAFEVTTGAGQVISARAILLATGSQYRRTGAPGEGDLIGAGVHFCATCDGPFYRGASEVTVVGGGNSGMEEGLFLTQFAEHVSILARTEGLTGSALLQEKVRDHAQIDVIEGVEVAAFNGGDNGQIASLTVRDLETGEEREHPTRGVFLFIGLDPTTEWLDGLVDLDERRFIVTDRNFQTSVPGIFAAGDVRSGSTKQLASAVGEGAAAAIQIRFHLSALDEVAGAGR